MKTKGFTLIETLIAIAIITISVAGPLYTASRAIVAAEVARDQVTASYLAQEGIEYVRMVRDNAFLGSYPANVADAWSIFLTSVASCRNASCTLDPSANGGSGSLAPYSAPAPLYLTNCANGSGGLACTPPNIYTQQNLAGSVVTLFTRTIQVNDVPGTDTDKKIVSTVSWSFHGSPYAVTITDHLTSWQ